MYINYQINHIFIKMEIKTKKIINVCELYYNVPIYTLNSFNTLTICLFYNLGTYIK